MNIKLLSFTRQPRFEHPSMSSFIFNSFPGVNNLLSKIASGTGNFSPNFLNKMPEESQQATGLLSKGRQFAIKLIFSGLYLCFTVLRRFVPSFILDFFTFFIPPVLAFYELALQVYFPRLPSLFAIAVKLCQRGILTFDTIIWLASSLPTNFLDGLGNLGGVAIQTTAAMVGVAASSGNALVGTATGFVGNASKTLVQDINHLKSGVVATDITHVLSDGSRIAANHATSITSLVENSESAVIENVSHLISGEHAISAGHLVPDIAKNAVHTVVDNTSAITDSAVGATKAAVTENATKLAHALDSINPLHLHIIPSESQDARARENISQVNSGEYGISTGHLVPDITNVHTVADNTSPVTDTAIGTTNAAVTENTAKLAHVLDSINPLHLHVMSPGSEPNARTKAISESEPLVPHNANNDTHAVVGTHAIADAGIHLATKPLSKVGRDHSTGGLLHPMLPGLL